MSYNPWSTSPVILQSCNAMQAIYSSSRQSMGWVSGSSVQENKLVWSTIAVLCVWCVWRSTSKNILPRAGVQCLHFVCVCDVISILSLRHFRYVCIKMQAQKILLSLWVYVGRKLSSDQVVILEKWLWNKIYLREDQEWLWYEHCDEQLGYMSNLSKNKTCNLKYSCRNFS